MPDVVVITDAVDIMVVAVFTVLIIGVHVAGGAVVVDFIGVAVFMPAYIGHELDLA